MLNVTIIQGQCKSKCTSLTRLANNVDFTAANVNHSPHNRQAQAHPLVSARQRVFNLEESFKHTINFVFRNSYAGVVNDEILTGLDLYPTLARLAGADLPETQRRRSIAWCSILPRNGRTCRPGNSLTSRGSP